MEQNASEISLDEVMQNLLRFEMKNLEYALELDWIRLVSSTLILTKSLISMVDMPSWNTDI